MRESAAISKEIFMIRIVIPGWGIPLSFYAVLKPDVIFNHGFFPSDADSAKNSDGVKVAHPHTMGTADGVEIPDSPYEVIAHSMGALVAFANSPLRNQAKKLVVFGGFAKFAKSDDNPHGTTTGDIDGMSDAVRTNPAKLLKRFHRLVALPERFKFQQIPEEINSDALLEGLEILKTRDIRGELKSSRTPTALFHGEKDIVVSAKLARCVASHIPEAKLTLVSNAGHALPFTFTP